ncbi:hypothetical protein GXW78_23945 [Roseomonas terrae]|uniref:Uncharacterized protein n=1 Tax=Neoroseomonas terrae TaxID=424799 RepID=A0ABS5ENY4_9PROT|nr:hypothetical protein [Neoroseomonas terrae]MBR0652731.1 hypothetical protein [Neoroseomonas terrae]
MTDTNAERRMMMRALPVLVAGAATITAAGCAAQTPFPNLTEAEENLAAALQSLHRAPDRFGGHKAEAIRLIHAALNEIEMARVAFR